MTVEAATDINGLNTALPDANDVKSEGDDHLRLIKAVLKQTFPNFAGRFRRFQSKSANYTYAPNDNASVIVFTAGSSLLGDAASAAATLGNGWHAFVFANGVDITIDPNGAETVNGAATVVLANGQAGVLSCDGAAFYLWLMPATLEQNGLLSKSVAGSSNVTLSAVEAQNLILVFTGILTGNINVILPVTKRVWTVFNDTTGAFSLTVKTAAGTGIPVLQGAVGFLAGDGTNIRNELVNIQPTVVNPANVSQTLTDAATVAWDANLGGIATVTLSANRIMGAPSNLKVGTYILHVLQDATGSRLLTWNAVFKWPAGTAPVLSTGINKRDIFAFVSDGTNLYAAGFDVR